MSGPSPPNIKLPGVSLHPHRRARSNSILKVEHVDSSNEVALDQAAYANINAEWVNRKGACLSFLGAPIFDEIPLHVHVGAWMIHVVLIATGKVVIDAIPGVTQNISWTAVNLCYLAVRSLPYFLERPHLTDHPSL